MSTKRILFILLVGGLALSAAAVYWPAAAQGSQGLRPDAPDYGKHGPFWVGVREFVVDPNAERPLRSLIWYPALNPKGLPESIDYKPIIQWFKLPDGVSNVSKGNALQDAAVDMSRAPYPLVIYSHALYAHPEMGAYIGEHLASYGFVVIAPYHTGEEGDSAQWGQSYINRAQDIPRVLDYAETLSKSGDLSGLYSMAHIGIVGWSSGGYTALTAGGARFNLAGYEKWCADHKDDPAASACADMLSHQKDLLALAKLDSMPKDLWPSWSDPRISAVVDQSGDALVFGASGLKPVSVPVMVLVGSQDTANVPQWNAYLAYDNVSSTQKAMAVFGGADHFIFGVKCADIPWVMKTDPGLYWACSDPVWDIDRAHDLINHLSTTFLLATLKGDKAAAAALAPDKVPFNGIDYKSKGF